MNTIKNIERVLQAESLDMGGFPVKQALPLNEVRMLDPFLLLHHAKTSFSPNKKAIHQGVGPHPHRGFSPVTFVIEGEIHHRDSIGNDQIARAGEVQWMNAGAGVIHSERPSQRIVQEKMPQEIIQLWINTPASHKMIPPSYKYLPESQMPYMHSLDGKILNKLVAGNYREMIQTSVNTNNELLIFWSEAESGGKQTFDIPKAFHTMLYLVDGQLAVNGQVVDKEQLVIFERTGNQLDISSLTNANFLIFSGKPLLESVFQHGPFVMSNRTEILEAMRDYEMGKMGFLVEQ